MKKIHRVATKCLKNNNYCITYTKVVISWRSYMLRIIYEVSYLSHLWLFTEG